MNDNNQLIVPGAHLLPTHGEVDKSSVLLGLGDNESRGQEKGLTILSIEQRLQQWLGDDASQQLLSAPPIRRSPMPAANLEPPRLGRSVRRVSFRLMAILGVTVQAFRRRSTFSGY